MKRNYTIIVNAIKHGGLFVNRAETRATKKAAFSFAHKFLTKIREGQAEVFAPQNARRGIFSDCWLLTKERGEGVKML